jgi:hypothetical protein
MTENTNATSVPDQGALNISTQLAASELPTNPQTSDDSVVFVEDGVWVDPRQEVTGKYVENCAASAGSGERALPLR